MTLLKFPARYIRAGGRVFGEKSGFFGKGVVGYFEEKEDDSANKQQKVEKGTGKWSQFL